ncbi:MAG: hypothetical protein M1286_01275 [Candidatus Marsarchaeota archaeon]|nr:hypothetical protein [Candidatus Marsarchaeota archaeon]
MLGCTLFSVVIATVIIATAYFSGPRLTGFVNANLRLSDIASATGVNYTAIKINNVSSFAGSLSGEGYRALSISEFVLNTTNHTISYPTIVTSALYSLSNDTAANQTEQSVLFVANQMQSSISGRFYGNTSVFNYSYSGETARMYNIFSIAVINASNAVLPDVAAYPVYQYSVAFQYKSYVAFITLNGYSNLSSYYSETLAKALFRNMIDSRI